MLRNHIVLSLLLSWALTPLLASGADFVVSDDFADTLSSGGTGPDMVVIPGGSFVMGGGSPGEDQAGQIKFDYLLAVSTTEITRGHYRQFLKALLSGQLRDFATGNDDLPVTGVSFDEVEAYVTWLSRETGHHYRLPSASEWEYASRAGSKAAYSWGSDIGQNRANCLDCKTEFNGQIAPVGSFPANSWGLYDMHGNVWEWTKDCIDSNTAPPNNGMPTLFGNCDLRELRGGSANSDTWSIRSSGRASSTRSAQTPDLGFRVVMDIPQQ